MILIYTYDIIKYWEDKPIYSEKNWEVQGVNH